MSCRASSIRSSRRKTLEGNGTRAGDHLRNHPGAWRHDSRDEPAGRRRALHDRTARRPVNERPAQATRSLIKYADAMMDEGFLTTEEVLDYLQVNLRTVYRLIKAGKIPAVRVGRQWRFRKRDIDAWLESQRPRAAPRISAAPARPVAPVAGGRACWWSMTRRRRRAVQGLHLDAQGERLPQPAHRRDVARAAQPEDRSADPHRRHARHRRERRGRALALQAEPDAPADERSAEIPLGAGPAGDPRELAGARTNSSRTPSSSCTRTRCSASRRRAS